MSAEPIADLAHARAAFDQWRAGRPGPGRLPEHLWALALSLVPRHSAQTVARELGLNPGRLRARLAKQRPATSRRSPKPAFVELRAVDLVPAPEPLTDTSLSLSLQAGLVLSARIERPDGATLTVTLPAGRGHLDEVCAAFLRA
jgi:transposase-like protein